MYLKSTPENPLSVSTIHYAKTPEFVNELGLVASKLLNPDDKTPRQLRKTIQKHRTRRQAIRALVAQSDIDPREVAGKTLSPRQYGAKLIHDAINDAETIFTFSARAFSKRHDNTTRAEMLKDNSVELLRMARLKDNDKGVILDSYASFKYKKPVEMVVGQNNTERLAWIKPISDMIDERHEIYKRDNMQKIVGCPAVQAFVELPDGRESLIHNFWNRYVDIMLEQPIQSVQLAPVAQAVEL